MKEEIKIDTSKPSDKIRKIVVVDIDSEYDPLLPNTYTRCWRIFKKTARKPINIQSMLNKEHHADVLADGLKNIPAARNTYNFAPPPNLDSITLPSVSPLPIYPLMKFSQTFNSDQNFTTASSKNIIQPETNFSIQSSTSLQVESRFDESFYHTKLSRIGIQPSSVVLLKNFPNIKGLSPSFLQDDIKNHYSYSFNGLESVIIRPHIPNGDFSVVDVYFYFNNIQSSIQLACHTHETLIGNHTILAEFIHYNNF